MPLRGALATGLAVPARAYVRHAPTDVLKPVLLRRLLEPTLRRHPRAFTTTTVDGVVVEGNTRDMIERYLYLFGVWEPTLTAWLRRRFLPGRTFVDVGANIGYYSLLAARATGRAGRVVAVEPSPDTFARLCRNLRRNGAGAVRALAVAAEERAGPVTLYGGQAHNSGTTSTVAAPGLTRLMSVDAAPLSELLTPEEVATTRVVKIDVEGGERAVLRGLLPALDAMPADVELVIEVTPAAGGHDVVELLSARGFAAYRLDNDYRLVSHLRRAAPAPPWRLRTAVTERTDLVFSRVDAETLP